MILQRSTPSIELVHHARDDLHTAATDRHDPPHGADFAAYGSALTGTIAALGWLAANLFDDLKHDEYAMIRTTEHGSALNDAMTYLSHLRTLLNASTNAACGYWEAVAKIDQNSPHPNPPSDTQP